MIYVTHDQIEAMTPCGPYICYERWINTAIRYT